jgi:hypothetical protein
MAAARWRFYLLKWPLILLLIILGFVMEFCVELPYRLTSLRLRPRR